MDNCRTASRPRGFSLIELLVVIGVILIVISLVMPGLSLTRAEAQRSVCRSEMRQLSLMVLMYCDDNRAKFPFPLSPRGDGNFEGGGRVWTPSRATAVSNYWPVAMFDDFGRSMYADALLCAQDRSSVGSRERTAAEMNIPVSEVQEGVMRGMSQSLLLDWTALKQDMEQWDDRYLHVSSVHDAVFPSQKALLVEGEPLHEPGYVHTIDQTGEYITPLADPSRQRHMVSALDGSARWQSRADAVPGVNVPGLFRQILTEAGVPADQVELNIRQMERPSYYYFTKDGVRGRDW
ncbi:MAG: prepilin-type N-terminal cleavage/methylation domain-containing protein [Phycisphaerales bacterium]|nr:prepilin-type N-terminal cleavage/methylation domain-containing protein [Phycisphaerales bacterium]